MISDTYRADRVVRLLTVGASIVYRVACGFGVLLVVAVAALELFAGMSLVMMAVALMASYIPAQRASRVDPLIALRAD